VTSPLPSIITKQRFKEALAAHRDELDILHFSCHSYFDQEQALKSGILLAPDQTNEEGRVVYTKLEMWDNSHSHIREVVKLCSEQERFVERKNAQLALQKRTNNETALVVAHHNYLEWLRLYSQEQTEPIPALTRTFLENLITRELKYLNNRG
jgi:hypothetical protein